MKSLLVTLLAFSSVNAFAAGHVDARNCELFIDKMHISGGSHGRFALNLFLKTINSHLDGVIKVLNVTRMMNIPYPIYSANPSAAATTRDFDELKEYNPDQCY